MPWECQTCNTEVLSDAVKVCPNCKTQKMAWTVNPNQTRTLQMTSRRRFELLRGEGSAPLASGGSYAKVVTSETERVLVVPKARGRDYQAAGKLPPPDQVLFVRCYPEKWGDQPDKLGLTVTPEFELKSMEQGKVEVPQETAPKLQDGRFDHALFFVAGEGEVDFSFPGLTVVDLTEQTKRGHAWKVGFEALKKKRHVLLCDPLEKGWCRRLECKQIQFNHDSHLLLPEGLGVLALVLEHAVDYPKEKLLIAGHTDATGEDRGYDNLGLSRRRAENILHLLVGDQAAWAASALECRTHLKESGASAKADVDAKTVEDWVGCEPKSGFAGFQKLCKDRRIAMTAASWDEVEAWKAVYQFYDDALRDQVMPLVFSKEAQDRILAAEDPRTGKKTDEARKKQQSVEVTALVKEQKAKLASGRAAVQAAFLDAERRTLGCGAHYLKIKTEAKSQTNRRLEFLFFDPERLPFQPGAGLSDDDVGVAVYGSRDTWDYVRCDGPYTFDRLDCPPEPLLKTPKGDVVVVIDISGSMTALDPGRTLSRFNLCCQQLMAFIDALGRDQSFTMIPFDNAVRPAWRPTLVPANLPNRRAAKYWISSTLTILAAARGSTNTYGALENAFQVSGSEAMVFLSDGLPTSGATTHEKKILNQVKTWNPGGKVHIDTYGFIVNPADFGATETVQGQVRARYKTDWLDKTTVAVDQEQTVRNAAVAQIATDLGIATAAANSLVLGDFMRDLASQNKGTFYDLNALLDAR
ncbi:MAG: hypothetical protein AB7N76_32000 [Planctomycetota bacterium]